MSPSGLVKSLRSLWAGRGWRRSTGVDPDVFVQALRALPDGPAMLVNIANALDQAGLVAEADVAAFLQRCAAWHGGQPAPAPGQPPVSPMRSLSQVANGDDGQPPWRRRQQVSGHDGRRLTTLVKWQDWIAYHVDKDVVEAHGEPLIDKPDPGEKHHTLEAHIAWVCSLRPWWRSAKSGREPACLGGPFSSGANIWFSTVDHDAGHAVPAPDVRGSAHLLASATGLAYPDGTWLLQYSVDADEVRRLAPAEIARPMFGDGGNGWFRIHNASPYGRHCAGLGWGNTAHLAPAAAGANDGRPERVVLRLPLDNLSSLQLRLVGQVQAEAHDPPVLSAARFEELLLDGGTLDAVVARLLACRA